MKHSFRIIAIGLAVLPFAMTGCAESRYPAYSATVKYGVRQDPILRGGTAAKLGDERYDPDRPGVFPIMKMDDIFNPDSPLFAKSKEINEAKDAIFRDPMLISAKDRQDLEEALEATFGTPASPKVAGIDKATIDLLKLDDDTLAKGSTYFRIHCLHCHGVPGDGRGPTARWINPHPRDFRQGLFKFQSIDQATTGQAGVPPARADLLRTLRSGIEGTAMPSFVLLRDDELEALASYVIHLSIRGTAELFTFNEDFAFDNKAGTLTWQPGDDGDPKSAVKIWAGVAAKKWKDSQDPAKVIALAKYPYKSDDMDSLKASVKRGQQLFTGSPDHPRGKNANCVSCHVDYGRQARFRFDDWGTLARPNNFSAGIFRGGKRPIDLYYRIHSGINGSGMTPFGNPAVLKGEDIWDLVNFVSNLSYPAMRERLDIKID